MKTLGRIPLFFAVLLLTLAAGLRAQDVEFNTLLFQTTFKIEGSAGPGSISFGTGFFMAKPIPESTKFQYVLITAKHVLEGIQADTATLNLRRKTNDGWQRVRYPI